jgi:hypothetical protein
MHARCRVHLAASFIPNVGDAFGRNNEIVLTRNGALVNSCRVTGPYLTPGPARTGATSGTNAGAGQSVAAEMRRARLSRLCISETEMRWPPRIPSKHGPNTCTSTSARADTAHEMAANSNMAAVPKKCACKSLLSLLSIRLSSDRGFLPIRASQ